MPSQQAHVSLLNELENSKLSLAKAISDAESLAGSKDAELSSLRDEARALEGYDPALEHAKELDGSVLRLQVIKGMGFEPVYERERGVRKMIVREFCVALGSCTCARAEGANRCDVRGYTYRRFVEWQEAVREYPTGVEARELIAIPLPPSSSTLYLYIRPSTTLVRNASVYFYLHPLVFCIILFLVFAQVVRRPGCVLRSA